MPPLGPDRGYLREIYDMTKENNRMLKSMRRSSLFWGVVKFLWWGLILIVLPAAAYYYYLSPLIDQAQTTYQSVQQGASQIQSAQQFLAEFIQNLFAKFGFGTSTPAN